MNWLKKKVLYEKIVFYCWDTCLLVVGYFSVSEKKNTDKEVLYHNTEYLGKTEFSTPGWIVVNERDEVRELMDTKTFMIVNSKNQQKPILYIIDPTKGSGYKMKFGGLFIPSKDLMEMTSSMRALKKAPTATSDRIFTNYINFKTGEVTPLIPRTTSIVVLEKKATVPIISLYTEKGKRIKGIDLIANKL